LHFKIFCCSSLDLVLFENLSSHVPFQDFQELRTTLKKQQEDVSLSLMNLGLQDATENDASNGSGEENTNVDLSANLGSLKVSRSP